MNYSDVYVHLFPENIPEEKYVLYSQIVHIPASLKQY